MKQFDFNVHLVNHIPIDDLIRNDFENDPQPSQSLRYLFKYLENQHQNIKALWDDIQVSLMISEVCFTLILLLPLFIIKNLLIKTMFLAEPYLLTEYRKSRPGSISLSDSVCFQLLRFNLLIDANLKPWLIEVSEI